MIIIPFLCWFQFSHECELIHPNWRGQATADWPFFLDFLEKQLQPILNPSKKKKGKAPVNSSSESESEAGGTRQQKKDEKEKQEGTKFKSLLIIFLPQTIKRFQFCTTFGFELSDSFLKLIQIIND